MLKINLSAIAGVLAGIAICLSSCGLIPEKGWILHQTSPFAGEQIVYISRDGVKSENPQMNLTCIVKASDPKIIYYNDKTKVYSEQTIEEWKADLQKRKAGVDGMGKALGEKEGKPLTKTGELEIAGINATQFTEGAASAQPAKTTGTGSELYFANDITVPPAFHLVAHKAMNVPVNNGVLLRMVVTTGDGEKVTALDTTKVERQDFPPDTFAAPTGYRRVKNDMEVLLGEGAGQAMEGLFKEFAKPETEKGVKQLMQTGESANQYLNSVNSELRAGKMPHSSAQSKQNLNNYMKQLQQMGEDAKKSGAH